jgi:hypothetical protein
MPSLDFDYLAVEDLLRFGLSILMLLMMLGIAVWFVDYIVETIVKVRRRIHPNRDAALLRENERLKTSLADAQEENDYLRKLYRNDLPPHAEDSRRKAA